MRSDKAKNTAKVLKKVLEDPLANEREIAKDTGVSKSSVNRAKKELGQNGSITKSAPIVEICQKDLEISKLAQEITLNMLKDPKQEKTLRDVVYAGKESSARYAIFK